MRLLHLIGHYFDGRIPRRKAKGSSTPRRGIVAERKARITERGTLAAANNAWHLALGSTLPCVGPIGKVSTP